MAQDGGESTMPVEKDVRLMTNNVIKDSVRFVKFAKEPGGDHTKIVVTLQPGGGNPLHYHQTFVETFKCNKGKLGVEIGSGNIRYLMPGESDSVPMSTPHRFFNDTDEIVEFDGIVSPGSTKFEQSLYIVYGLANDGLTDETAVPKSLVHLAVFTQLGDTSLCGGAALMNPVLRAFYAYARWSGVEKQLIDKYCPHLA